MTLKKSVSRLLVEEVSPRGIKNNSDAFEAFGLFREYLDSKLSDLRQDINDQTLKLKRKAPTFR